MAYDPRKPGSSQLISETLRRQIAGSRLQPGVTPAQSPDPASPDNLRRVSQAVYNPARYGDMSVKPIVYAAAGDSLVLERPRNTRIFAVIQNNLAAGNISVNFDAVASATNGILIAPGGNLLFDNAVPQNDIHVFASGAGFIIVGFINIDMPYAV